MGGGGGLGRGRGLCLCQNCLLWPSAENNGTGSLLNCPSYPQDGVIGQGHEPPTAKTRRGSGIKKCF